MDLINENANNETIYVFGAGRVAKSMYRVLEENGITVESFLVSDVKENVDYLEEKSVIRADSPACDRSKQVQIAVVERGQKRIRPYLESLGYKNIIDCPKDALELDSWEYARARSPIIEVTAKIGCSVNCRYCPQKMLVSRYYKDNPKRKGVMTLEDYKGYLDKCPNNTIVDFSGFVEPFLVSDSIKMMEYTYITGHEMTLFTTLRGLSIEQAKHVISMPFKYVCLHTPDKDGYASIPMTDEYFNVLELFLDAKKSSGEPFVDAANCQSEPHPNVVKMTQGRLKIYCEMSDRAGNLDEEDPFLSHVKTAGRIYCSRAIKLNHNVLLPDGSLALCCNDFGLDYILGNLNQQSYEEIMQGESMIRVKRAMHINLEDELICRKCMFAEEIDN